jgi:hypothetical protein
MLNIKKKEKNFFYPYPHLPHVLPLSLIQTTPNFFQLISTTSRLISQNFKLIGQTNAEIMRDMTQTTDTTNVKLPFFFLGR